MADEILVLSFFTSIVFFRCHLKGINRFKKAIERFPVHCLLLTGYDVIDGIECWELQDSQGVEWGTNGFIMMEQHRCLIKSVVELKVIFDGGVDLWFQLLMVE
ncbi:unnamed protein product [Eruca vesicaria subsp. sativa]|uniref:Peptidase C1A papain C-terminal domain-containing protein n=1 Tax=Eruca vesicaria subsp. sativa TaxID=29727 RepID=A0ABC8JS87_ERUVS|nr:unnamed protein product [Eruca vesicaria subsp. sativa]